MGVDFRPGGANWSYGGFHGFRKRLAAEIGIQLDKMAGFEWPSKVRGKSWDEVNDPIVPFLNHSDCDGELSPVDCMKVAPRLREIVSTWDDDYDKRQALILADAMDECAKTNRPLEFR